MSEVAVRWPVGSLRKTSKERTRSSPILKKLQREQQRLTTSFPPKGPPVALPGAGYRVQWLRLLGRVRFSGPPAWVPGASKVALPYRLRRSQFIATLYAISSSIAGNGGASVEFKKGERGKAEAGEATAGF